MNFSLKPVITRAPDGVPGGMTVVKEGNDAGREDTVTTVPVTELERVKQELTRKYETDISQLRSTLDSRLGEADKQRRAALEELNKVRMSQMSEPERLNFQRQTYEEQLQQLNQEREALGRERQERQEIQNAVRFFTEQGIDAKDIDTTSLKKASASGYIAMAEQLRKLRELQAQPKVTTDLQSDAKANDQEKKGPAQNSTKTITNPGGQVPTQEKDPIALLTAEAARYLNKPISEVTWDQVVSLMDSQRIDPNVVLQNT